MDVHRHYKGTLWSSFDAMANDINANSIAGFNYYELEVG